MAIILEHLTLYRSIGISGPAIVSFYGAGGKTTLLLKLASEMAEAGQKALLTTTTRFYRPSGPAFFTGPEPERVIKSLKRHFETGNLAVFGKSMLPDGKVEGIGPEQVDYLRNRLQVSVLVEADGARGKSLKGYAPYEPVIPSSSDYIVPVLGGDTLGKVISSENTHRIEYFTAGTGCKKGEEVTEKILAESFLYMMKLGRSQAPRARCCLILNKGDLLNLPGRTALKTAALFKEKSGTKFPGKLLITEGLGQDPVRINLDLKNPGSPVQLSCVILAAGKATRMGLDKLSLKAKDKTILEHTLQNVTASGFKDIVVVTAPGKSGLISPGEIDKAGDVSIKVVENPSYREGISTSLKKGLQAISAGAQGVLFALADQPHISVSVYIKLQEAYENQLPLITCPTFRNIKGNPVLFDRRTWPKLMAQGGDRGGRSVIGTIEPEEVDYVEVETPAIIWDIDTPEDYLLLLDALHGI